jgi:Uma2 family endonuclease
MTALLEVPAIRQRVKRISVADYHRLTEGQPTELLRGTIIEKMSKSPAHQYFIDCLRKILEVQISPEFVVRTEGPIATADSEPEPDVLVLRGPLGRYRHAHATTAELVVEIALSSLEIDRVKAQIYAEAKVKEYWIVCPEENRVEVFRQPGTDNYAEQTIVAPPAILECAALPGVRVDLAALFA